MARPSVARSARVLRLNPLRERSRSLEAGHVPKLAKWMNRRQDLQVRPRLGDSRGDWLLSLHFGDSLLQGDSQPLEIVGEVSQRDVYSESERVGDLLPVCEP